MMHGRMSFLDWYALYWIVGVGIVLPLILAAAYWIEQLAQRAAQRRRTRTFTKAVNRTIRTL